jgi:hypothetical protein
MLYVALTTPFRNNSRMIGALNGYPSIATKPMMDIYPTLGIMQVAAATISARTNGRAIGQMYFTTCRLSWPPGKGRGNACNATMLYRCWCD